MEVLLMLVMGVMCIICFIVGAKVGQTVTKGDEVKLPNLNPMNAVIEHNSKKQAERERNQLETILHNVEAYNGTGQGQKDVPRR